MARGIRTLQVLLCLITPLHWAAIPQRFIHRGLPPLTQTGILPTIHLTHLLGLIWSFQMLMVSLLMLIFLKRPVQGAAAVFSLVQNSAI